MRYPIRFLFAKSTGADPSQGQSGGRGLEPAPDAISPASGAEIPLDSPDFPRGQAVRVKLEKGGDIIAFLDPVYGWMDANGVKLPEGCVPASWRPL